MTIPQTRRRFLTTLSIGGAASFVHIPSSLATAEGHLETTAVRLVADYSICSPVLLSEELLRAEGFTDVRYVERAVDRASRGLASAAADFRLTTPWDVARRVDGGEPITALGGVHIGCFELFAREGIRNIADLKGKTVGESNRIG
jgi:NitT/TauT family transport system substrate-binding protein